MPIRSAILLKQTVQTSPQIRRQVHVCKAYEVVLANVQLRPDQIGQATFAGDLYPLLCQKVGAAQEYHPGLRCRRANFAISGTSQASACRWVRFIFLGEAGSVLSCLAKCHRSRMPRPNACITGLLFVRLHEPVGSRPFVNCRLIGWRARPAQYVSEL